MKNTVPIESTVLLLYPPPRCLPRQARLRRVAEHQQRAKTGNEPKAMERAGAQREAQPVESVKR